MVEKPCPRDGTCRESGSKLSDKSLEAVRKLRRTNPQLIQEMADEGWFIAVTDYTIEEAFKEFIKQKERDGNASRTIKNWKNTAQRIFLYLNPTTPCSQITLKLVKDVFRSLRNHENRWGERFSPITLQKDSKNLRQLFRDLLENKDITENPIDKYRFKIEKWERPKPVPPVSDDVFAKFCKRRFIPEELQQKTLLAYYRIMSARQNDPTILSRGRSRWRSLGRRRPKEKDGQSLERQTQSETRLSTCAAWYVEAVDDLERSGHCQRRSSGWANLSLAE